MADIAEAKRQAGAEAHVARGRQPDKTAVAIDRLVMQQKRIGTFDGEMHEAFGDTLRLLPAQHILAEEAGLLPGDGKAEAGLERRFLGADIVAPMAIALLQPATVERVVAAGDEVVELACFIDRRKQLFGKFGRDIELKPSSPTKLTRVALTSTMPI